MKRLRILAGRMGAARMRVGYLECFAGISGDMFMGALVDAGAPLELLEHAARSLGLNAELRVSKVNRSGIHSTKIDVVVRGEVYEKVAPSGAWETSHPDHSHDHAGSDHAHDHAHDHGHSHEHADHHHHGHPDSHEHPHPHGHGRKLAEIRTILQNAHLSGRAAAMALRAFEFLGEAEARVHGIAIDQVHFHEVGAVDAIVDVVCGAVAVDALGLDRWYASPVNVGGGFVQCAHGHFPVPAPATAELLKASPIYSAGPQVEMVTPTGAALLRSLECRFENPGVLRSESIGYGAGTRDPKSFPNVLRLTIGQIDGAGATCEQKHGRASQGDTETVVVIECAIDDLNPQVLAYAAQLALERGALDVMSTPVTMKKGRLGTLLTVLAKPADVSDLSQLLFRETTTLGLRVREEQRICLDRQFVPVETEFGVIRMKVGLWQDEEKNALPEFEDCRRAAEASDVPVKRVMQAALAQWRLEVAREEPRSGARE